VNSGSPTPLSDPAARAQVLQHVQTLIARTQSFFAERQDAHLKNLRAHLFELVDGRPGSAQSQNLRTAAVMLDKQAARFTGFFQAALREAIEDELEAVVPGALRLLRPADDSGMSSGPLSMALLDVDEIERHLLVDRVSQRFNASYDAALKPLTAAVGVLLQQEQLPLSDNPFRPAAIIRAYSLAWHASEFDPLAAEDFLGALDPRHAIDWAPLYAGLTETLVRAGYTAKPVHRIKRTSGADSGHAPLQDIRESGPGKGSAFGASVHSGLESGFAQPEAAGSALEAGASRSIAQRASM
jgi:hypothetical protein